MARPVDILNLSRPRKALSRGQFRHIIGDGCQIEFSDSSYDLVFLNLTIEHVGGYTRAQLFADEVRRVGRGYWVQAPCRQFPIEPHFLFPWFQYLLIEMKKWMAVRWPYGWQRRAGMSPEALREDAASIWFPTTSDMKELFPDGRPHIERVLGLPKSISIFRPISDT